MASDWGSVDLGGTIGTLQAGGTLRVAHWPGTARGPGTVILVQGYGEFMEIFGEAVAEFRRRGYAVISFDFRGQGGSTRRVKRATHLGSIREHVNDLLAVTQFAADLELPRPFFVAAHSMGGLVALHAADQLAPQVSRMVLFAPLLAVHRLPVPEPLAVAGAAAACAAGFARKAVAKSIVPPRDVHNNHLTGDPDRYVAMCDTIDANPDLVSGPPTFGWVRTILGATAAMRARADKPLAMPTLMLAAGRDAVVSTLATDRFARAVPGGGLVMLPSARHHVLFETDGIRKAAFAAFDAFVGPAVEEARQTETPARPARIAKAAKFAISSMGTPVSVEEPEVPVTLSTDVAEPAAVKRRSDTIIVHGTDALLHAPRRRTTVVEALKGSTLDVSPTPRAAAKTAASPTAAPDTPAPADAQAGEDSAPAQPANTREVDWSSTDSVDILLRMRRRRSARRREAAQALSSDRVDDGTVDWTSEDEREGELELAEATREGATVVLQGDLRNALTRKRR